MTVFVLIHAKTISNFHRNSICCIITEQNCDTSNEIILNNKLFFVKHAIFSFKMKKFILLICLIQVIFTVFAANNVVNYAICPNSSDLIFVCEEAKNIANTQINVENSNKDVKRVEGADTPIPTFENFQVRNQVSENVQFIPNNGAIGQIKGISSQNEIVKISPEIENMKNPEQLMAATGPAYSIEKSTEQFLPEIDPLSQKLRAQSTSATSENTDNQKKILETPKENIEKLPDAANEVSIVNGQENKTAPSATKAIEGDTVEGKASENPVPNVAQPKSGIITRNSAEIGVKPEVETKVDPDTTGNSHKPTAETKTSDKLVEHTTTATDESHLKCFFGDAKTIQIYPKKNFVSISYEKCHFTRLPTTINKFSAYKNLKVLNISNVKLEIFDMIQGANLEVILASHNNLTVIPSWLFPISNNLNRLDLSHNRINRIDSLAFTDLAHLRFLNLSWNSLTTIDSTLFGKLVNLEYLDLSHNKLATLDATLFSQLLNLNELKLSDNSIDKIDASTFSSLKRLQHLDLSHLKLTDIEIGTFSHLIELKSLNLSKNHFKKIDFEIFSGLNNLMSIDLNGNQLVQLKGFEINSLPHLKIVAINNNQFNCSFLETLFNSTKSIDFVNGQPTKNADNINGVLCKKPGKSMEEYIEGKLEVMVNNIENIVSTMKLSFGLLCFAIFALIVFIVAIRRKVNKVTGRSAIYELREDVDGRKEGKAVICI